MSVLIDKPSKGDRISQLVTKVDELVDAGVPVARACRNAGLSKDTYYFRKRKRESAATELPESTTEAADTIHSDSSTASPNAEGIGS